MDGVAFAAAAMEGVATDAAATDRVVTATASVDPVAAAVAAVARDTVAVVTPSSRVPAGPMVTPTRDVPRAESAGCPPDTAPAAAPGSDDA
jgi:hypothetical protein